MKSQSFYKINWNDIKTNIGMATGVPAALEGLTSDDPQMRHCSYWQLDNVVVLQSDLSEAACVVVPYLVEMLEHGPAYGRDKIYDLLYEIANGYAPDDYLWRTPEGEGIPLRIACLEQVKKGTKVFERDLTDQDDQVKSKASELLELLRSSSSEEEIANS